MQLAISLQNATLYVIISLCKLNHCGKTEKSYLSNNFQRNKSKNTIISFLQTFAIFHVDILLLSKAKIKRVLSLKALCFLWKWYISYEFRVLENFFKVTIVKFDVFVPLLSITLLIRITAILSFFYKIPLDIVILLNSYQTI